MTVQRRVGAYAKLLANYASDDAIIAAGEKAELLFVRGLAFCATSDSDGYITEAQLVRFVGAGMSDAKKRAQTLVREGVWDRVDGGYQIRSWLKIHPSSEEKGYKRKTDRERKHAKAEEEFQTDSVRNPDGTSTDGARESLNCSVVTESLSSTDQFNTHQGRAATPRDGAPNNPPAIGDDPKPDRYCPKHMPDGPKGNCGNCGDARRRLEAWEKRDEQRAATVVRMYREAIAACDMCDEHGRRLDPDTLKPIGACTHRQSA